MKHIQWTETAKRDMRTIDRSTAMQILATIDHYARTGTGDVKKLRPPFDEIRLRAGDWRVFFTETNAGTMQITRVVHRSRAYRP